MNVNFEYYRIFYSVANHRNITKAAKELMISQPAISKSIKKLEEQLGGQLFVRTKRGVTLTLEGAEFYQYIKQAMEFINNAENKFSDLMNLETGTIRIGINTTLTKQFLIPYLEKFHKLYPKIDIQISTNLSSELFTKLKDGLLDLVVLNLPYPKINDIEIKEIKAVQDCFIVGREYEYLTKKTISLNELVNFPLILQSQGSTTRKFFDNYAMKNNVIFQPVMNLSSYSLVVEFTRIGFGIGYATEEFIENELRNKDLFKLNVDPAIPSRSIGIAYSKKNLPNFSTKKFIQMIIEK